MRATLSCSNGVRADSRLDYIGDTGAFKAQTLYIATRPDRVRFDVVSPFGAVLSTLTSDGTQFALFDGMQKVFVSGPAQDCNIQNFTKVPVPATALVMMLGGEAPVLVHEDGDASIAWESGAYVIRVRSLHGATQEIHLVPMDEDFDKAWQEQRVLVKEVRVVIRGVELYRAQFDKHHVAKRADALVDPDGIDDDVAPSGPVCSAMLPRKLHFKVQSSGQDLIVENRSIEHNPPIPDGFFEQFPPGGVRQQRSTCRDENSAPTSP